MSNVSQLTIKHRPKIWDEIIGHDVKVKELRKRAVDQDYPNVTYFTGLSGTGKDTLKLIYLKTMFCKAVDEKGNPCNTCQTCKSIDGYDFEGVYGLEVYDSSNVNIEKARDISDSAKTVLFGESSKRVYVFNELQEFNKNKSALKNLLTTFERPMDNVHFIFDSMEFVQLADKNSKTSISDRTQVYKMKPVDTFELVSYLSEICEKENVEIDTEEKANILMLLAEKAGGSVRNALSNLERVIKSELWTEELVCDELEIYSDSTLSEIINNICLGKSEELSIKVTEDLFTNMKQVLTTLVKHFCGIKLNSYEQDKIKNLSNKIEHIDTMKLMGTISDFLKRPYFDITLAYYELLSLALINKNNKKGKQHLQEEKKKEPVRRRVVEQ